MEPKGLRQCRKELIAIIEEKAQSLGMPVAVKRIYEHPVTLQECFRIDFQNKVIDLEFSKKEIAFLDDLRCQIDGRISEALEKLTSASDG